MEWYPGQNYFHAHRPAIKRAEENFFATLPIVRYKFVSMFEPGAKLKTRVEDEDEKA
jgi:hypothetical protein